MSDTNAPLENPYASPDGAPLETPSVIPDIAAPEDAIDGPDALRLAGEITTEISRRASDLVGQSGRVKFIVGAVGAILMSAFMLFGGYFLLAEVKRDWEQGRIPDDSDPVSSIVMIPFIILTPLLVLARQIYVRRARSVFRQGRFTGYASPRGIELTYHDTDEVVRIGWNFLTGAMGDGAVLILYAYPESCLLLPRAAFASQGDWDRFRDWIRIRKIKPIGQGYA